MKDIVDDRSGVATYNLSWLTHGRDISNRRARNARQ